MKKTFLILSILIAFILQINANDIYLNYCTMNGVNGINYNPCESIIINPSQMHYTLKGYPNTTIGGTLYDYNSLSNGCIFHFLVEGDYEIIIFDDINNTTTRNIIHVRAQQPVMYSCIEEVSLGCNEAFDPNTVLFDCPCFSNIALSGVTFSNWIISQTANGEIYNRTAYDPLNCRQCDMQINVTKTPIDVFECVKNIEVPCGELYDINSTQFDCIACGELPNNQLNPIVWNLEVIGTSQKYTYSKFDPIACRQCNYTINLTQKPTTAEYYFDIATINEVDLKDLFPCGNSLIPGLVIKHTQLYEVQTSIGLFQSLVNPSDINYFSDPIINSIQPQKIVVDLIPTDGSPKLYNITMYLTHYYEITTPWGCVCTVKIHFYDSRYPRLANPNPTNNSSNNESITVINIKDLENNINIYPNPFTDKINIDYNLLNNTDVNINILNANGEIVKTDRIINASKGNNTYSLNLESLPNGLFIINMKGENFSATQKINHIK
jgi:hypothetical protein